MEKAFDEMAKQQILTFFYFHIKIYILFLVVYRDFFVVLFQIFNYLVLTLTSGVTQMHLTDRNCIRIKKKNEKQRPLLLTEELTPPYQE